MKIYYLGCIHRGAERLALITFESEERGDYKNFSKFCYRIKEDGIPF